MVRPVSLTTERLLLTTRNVKNMCTNYMKAKLQESFSL